MKQCLICHTDADDAVPTCAACGEASWSESTAPVDTAADTEPALVDETDVTTGDASPQAKRGKRK